MDAAERALLEDTVGAALAAGATAAAADAALAELGWLEMLEAEPRDAVDIVFGALGATNSTATVLDDVVVSALGLQPRADLAVLLPQFGAWAVARSHRRRARADAVGLATARAATAGELLVVCTAGRSFARSPCRWRRPTIRAGAGRRSRRRASTSRASNTSPVSAPRSTPTAWEAAVAFGRRAVAHQIAGASRTMLDLARDHALERVQFGRPIASFQAVRHRLADALVAVEALDATLGAAGDEPNALTAALAKATAGRTARTVAAHCQQVLAGIGFTTDHPFHRYLKRTMLLEGLFGSADDDRDRHRSAAARRPVACRRSSSSDRRRSAVL